MPGARDIQSSATSALGCGDFSFFFVGPAFNKDMLLRVSLLALLARFGCAFAQLAALPGTEPLRMEGDLSAQMVEGVDRFLSNQTRLAAEKRSSYWQRDFSSPAAYEKSIEQNRERLRYLIGARDERIPFRALEIVSTSDMAAPLAEMHDYTITAVRWPVLDGVHGEGLWLKQKGKAKGAIIALPDADQTPEMISGIAPGCAPDGQFARRLAELGFDVLVPVLINRDDRFSGSEELKRFTNQPHREWIYRQAYELGRTPIGYEVEKVMALVDWLKTREQSNIGVAGYGEGGLIALYAAALDPHIATSLISGYFSPREKLWSEPIYRNVFSLIREFGDAEIASMIAPRRLIVEYSEAPKVDGPPPPRQGRSGAAPGRISTPERYEVEEELERARAFFPTAFKTDFHMVNGSEGALVAPGSDKALQLICEKFGSKLKPLPAGAETKAQLPFPPEERQRRQIKELVDHIQHQMIVSERQRNEQIWKPRANLKATEWQERCGVDRTNFWENVIGRFPAPQAEMHPRSRLVYEKPTWKGYEVVLDVWPEVFAWGILLVPNDLKPGEKRPVIVCQHGLEGVPKDTIEGPESRGYGPYKSFAARLAERGFITFAPHNPYRGEDKFRVLQRKSNPLGRTLFSTIIGQHEQILNWLQSLPFADPQRIGFYGLSYGGKSAMRIPAVLDRYVLSICSADFNDWVKKNVTVDSTYSYMFGGEYDMPEFALGPQFNYAEMAALIAPRPFMVERGHGDGVAPDEWVAYEFAKVRRFYDQLGLGDRTEIEVFNGPHTINGQGTFSFLERHLAWPKIE